MNKTGSSYFNHCPCETETQTDETLDKLNKENIEICDKISNLTNTLNDPKKVEEIGPVQITLMKGQLEAMQTYADILCARIRLLK
jgi:hypothetical protein